MTTSFKLLKGILSVALFFSSALWLIFLTILGGILFGFEGNFGLENITKEIDLTSNAARISFVVYILAGYAVIVYIIYTLRKLVASLNSGRIFTRFQSTGFNLVGWLIIWLVIVSAISEFILKLVINSRFEIEASFSDFWLFLALGTFFIVLGQVFEKARLMREENELTV